MEQPPCRRVRSLSSSLVGNGSRPLPISCGEKYPFTKVLTHSRLVRRSHALIYSQHLSLFGRRNQCHPMSRHRCTGTYLRLNEQFDVQKTPWSFSKRRQAHGQTPAARQAPLGIRTPPFAKSCAATSLCLPGWESPELNGGFLKGNHSSIIVIFVSIAMFDYTIWWSTLRSFLDPFDP